MYIVGLPPEFWIFNLFLFGLIIGSFLNVLIYRLHTGKSLNDRSHCLSCGTTLTWYDLFPVFSYLFLLGRCRSCGSYIPNRYLIVEILTGVMFALAYSTTASVLELVLTLLLVCVLVVGVVYDLYHMIIPNEIVISVAVIAPFILFSQTQLQSLVPVLLWAGLSSVIAFLFFGGLWYFSSGRWVGFGDAKLVVGLGFLVGLSGVFSLLVFSFWIGALISVVIISLQFLAKRGQQPLRFLTGELTMKSEIPFAPFLVSAFVLVYFFGLDVLSLTNYALSFIYQTPTF